MRETQASAIYWEGFTHLCFLASFETLVARSSRPGAPRVYWKILEVNQVWMTMTSARPGKVGDTSCL